MKLIDKEIQVSLRTLGGVATLIVTLVGMWFTLQRDIAEARELPPPAITRLEFDLKDQIIQRAIMSTQEDILEIKSNLEDIKTKLYE
jgi:hypothetical protein